MVNIKFADTLKNLIAEIMDISRETLEYYKNFYYTITNNNNKIFTRQFMLNLGTDIVRYGTNSEDPFIKNYLNEKLSREELEKRLIKAFFKYFDIDNKKELVFKDINDESKTRVFNLKEFKEKVITILMDFIENNKDILLKNEDVWNSMVKKSIPDDKLSVITDARFKQEFLTFIEDPKYKDRLTIALIIKEDENENKKLIPWIENQGKRVDNNMLYYLYNNATDIEELEKNIREYSGLPPAESFNVVLTLYAIKKLNKERMDKKMDEILMKHPIVRNLKIWNFPYGISQKDIGTKPQIQNYLHKRKDNEILMLAGCSGNGKDYVYEAIEKLKSEYNMFTVSISNRKNKDKKKFSFLFEVKYKVKFNDKNEIVSIPEDFNIYISSKIKSKKEIKFLKENLLKMKKIMDKTFKKFKDKVFTGKHINISKTSFNILYDNILDYNNDIFNVYYNNIFNKKFNPENHKIFEEELERFLNENPEYQNRIEELLNKEKKAKEIELYNLKLI